MPVKKFGLLRSPEGELVYFDSIQEFASEHNLSNASVTNLLKGRRVDLDGWTLPKQDITIEVMDNRTGERYSFTSPSQMVKKFGFRDSCCARLFRGTAKKLGSLLVIGRNPKFPNLMPLGPRRKGCNKPRSGSLQSPTGEVFNFDCVTHFARAQGLSEFHLKPVLDGRRYQYHGWSLPFCGKVEVLNLKTGETLWFKTPQEISAAFGVKVQYCFKFYFGLTTRLGFLKLLRSEVVKGHLNDKNLPNGQLRPKRKVLNGGCEKIEWSVVPAV